MSKVKIDEILEDMTRHAKTKFGEPRPCRCCDEDWAPVDWNFYDLCEKCFVEFDAQKMRGRFPPQPGEAPAQLGVDYFESSTDWIATKVKARAQA